MGFIFRFFACVVFAAAWIPSAPAAEVAAPRLDPGTRIVCPGEYAGHLQGLATDGKAIYWSFSKDLVKTDFAGNLLGKVKIPHHGGGPCWSNGKLYVPVCGSGFNRKPKPGVVPKNFVYVFDPELKLLEKRHIPETEFGAGGMAAKDGHFFIVGGRPAELPGNTVYEYDADFDLVRRHELDFDSNKGIQTVNYFRGRWYFGCYGIKGRTVVADEEFRVLRRVRPSSSFGMIPLAEGLVLVGRSVANGKKFRVTAAEVERITAEK